MNNFKKAALASSVIAMFGIYSDASAEDVGPATPVVIGCTVPNNTTAAATVYSIDAYDSNAAALTNFPTWFKAGASCTKAVNWMLAAGGANADLSSVTNQVANGGYTLQSFVFGAPENGQSGANQVANHTDVLSMIGCAAPASGTAGAVIYSVDNQNSAGSTTGNTGVTLTALGGNPCSSGLAATGAGELDASVNLRTADGAYSLMQYIVQ